jgi:dihydroxyacetone kinase-like predicted kinase
MNANKTRMESLVKDNATATIVYAVSPYKDKPVRVSEHKLDELAGLHEKEPLLTDKQHRRFVLFPIQDNDVSK